MTKNFILYKITNTVNKKIYIGQTIGKLSNRWSNHKYKCLRGVVSKLYTSMRKYGINVFEIEELCRVNDIDELNELEEFVIQELNTIENGYNIAYGGMNKTWTNESKKKASDSAKGRILSEEIKMKISNTLKGRLLSKQTKQKMSESRTGRVVTEETKIKISKSKMGYKQSEEHRKNNGNARRGKKIKKGSWLVSVIDLLTNVEYCSITECCENLNITISCFYHRVERNTHGYAERFILRKKNE